MTKCWKTRIKSLMFAVCVTAISIAVVIEIMGTALSTGSAATTHPRLSPRRIPVALDTVRVPGGTFMMGDSVGDGNYSERPSHLVRVSPFRIGRCEVTRRQCVRFLNEVKVSVSPLCVISHGSKEPMPTHSVNAVGFTLLHVPDKGITYQDGVFEVEGEPELPAIVTWFGAALYCGWAGGRLPTEAEFEYAARAGSKSARAPATEYRSNLDGAAGGPEAKLKAVKSYAANAWGLRDMMGNAPEWCEDWDAAYNYNLEYWRQKAQSSDYWAKTWSNVLETYDFLTNPYYQRCKHRFSDAVLDPMGPEKPGEWFDSKVIRYGWTAYNATRRGGWMLGEEPTGRYSARNRAQPWGQVAGFRVVFPVDGRDQ